MKVIIIKNCKDGKINDVIDVASGYATNFLIKQGFALPVNNATKYKLNKQLEEKAAKDKKKLDNAIKAKKAIESLVLNFKLKTTDLVVHGSITRKQIVKELKKHGITVDSTWVENVKINSLGTSYVAVHLHKEIDAKIKIEVESNG